MPIGTIKQIGFDFKIKVPPYYDDIKTQVHCKYSIENKMKNKHFFLKVAIIFALSFWLLDSLVHYFIYGELEFEIIPTDLNELWMRFIIVVLLITFGMFVDYHTNKIFLKSIEKYDVYKTMLNATHHILNNFLQKMMFFRDAANESADINKKIIETYDEVINDTLLQIKELEDIKNPSKETIENKFLPK